MNKTFPFLYLFLVWQVSFLSADVSLPAIFSDHAVLQRNMSLKIWGWADPSEKVTVDFVGKSIETKADSEGKWEVDIPSQKAGGPHKLMVSGKNRIEREDLLFGEVWLCSGQSNMGFKVGNSINGDLVSLKADDPQLRLVTISNLGTQKPEEDFKGQWVKANAQSVASFSAVGYFFGRELRQVLNVPVGLINNAWGGSACEAWVSRDILDQDERYKTYIENFEKKVAAYDSEKMMSHYEDKLNKWKEAAKKAKLNKTAKPRPPRKPSDPAVGQHRPANLYNGRIVPILGYGMKGAIWYQGENNTNDNRSYDYRYLLPLMIKRWRTDWGIGDFSFYWSQLADFAKSRDVDGSSSWGEMRESMTIATHKVKNSGQAVITDLGEDKDIHPRNKIDVAKRLVRHALAKDYGYEIACQSPEYKSHSIKGQKVIIEFNHAEMGFRSFDVKEALGFAVAGKDQKYVEGKAVIKGNKIEVWSDSVVEPVAVRYAWASNPVCNVYGVAGDLPLTPFRTDNWKLSSQLID